MLLDLLYLNKCTRPETYQIWTEKLPMFWTKPERQGLCLACFWVSTIKKHHNILGNVFDAIFVSIWNMGGANFMPVG